MSQVCMPCKIESMYHMQRLLDLAVIQRSMCVLLLVIYFQQY